MKFSGLTKVTQLAAAFVFASFTAANDAGAQAVPVVSIGAEGSGAEIEVKAGADIASMAGPIEAAYDDIVAAYRACGVGAPVITSGRETESEHMTTSWHYVGRAVDLRANDIPVAAADCIVAVLQERLGQDYYVAFEYFGPRARRNHIHLEYDPRTAVAAR